MGAQDSVRIWEPSVFEIDEWHDIALTGLDYYEDYYGEYKGLN